MVKFNSMYDKNSHKKIIVLIIAVLAISIVVALISFIVIEVKKQNEIKAENQRIYEENLRKEEAKESANEVFESIVNEKQEEDESFKMIDVYGYIFVVEKGEGFSDYVYMAKRTGEIEYKNKVDFDYNKKTIKNEDGSEYLILSIDGKKYPLSVFEEIEIEEYKDSNVYVFNKEYKTHDKDEEYQDNGDHQNNGDDDTLVD